MTPNKACPILFRDPGLSRILVFKHPSAGIQLVKGTIESEELPADAAIRELREESGISNAKVDRDLGLWVSGFENQIWSLQLCSTVSGLPDSWIHRTEDDGGLNLRFYWHPVDRRPDHHWHPLFQGVLQHVLDCI